MNTSVKGAVAAGAAAILLMGGAGTLAYWSDSVELPGGSIQTGELKLEDETCASGWVYGAGSAAGSPVTRVVPGDVIEKECTFDIVAIGDNLSADLTVPSTATFGTGTPGSFTATVAATYEDADGDPVPSTITDADDGPVTATITVTFPFGTAETATTPVNINETQGITATLDAITVSVEQNAPS